MKIGIKSGHKTNIMFLISFSFEILALLTGLVYYYRIKSASFRLLIPLLLLTVINEGFAYYKVYADAGLNKTQFYIGFFFLEMICFYVVYKYWFRDEGQSKNIANLIFFISMLLAVVSILIWGGNKLNPFFLNAVCLCMIGLGIMYYRFVFQRKQVYLFIKDPMFWLSTGVIFVNFIHLLFVNAVFIDSFRQNPSSGFVFQVLNTIGNIFYYGCIIIAFICSSRYPRQVGTS